MTDRVYPTNEHVVPLVDDHAFQFISEGRPVLFQRIDGNDVSIDLARRTSPVHETRGTISVGAGAQIREYGHVYACGDDAAHGSIGHVIRMSLTGEIEWILTTDYGPYENIWWYCGGIWVQSPTAIHRIDDGPIVRIRTFDRWPT